MMTVLYTHYAASKPAILGFKYTLIFVLVTLGFVQNLFAFTPPQNLTAEIGRELIVVLPGVTGEYSSANRYELEDWSYTFNSYGFAFGYNEQTRTLTFKEDSVGYYRFRYTITNLFKDTSESYEFYIKVVDSSHLKAVKIFSNQLPLNFANQLSTSVRYRALRLNKAQLALQSRNKASELSNQTDPDGFDHKPFSIWFQFAVGGQETTISRRYPATRGINDYYSDMVGMDYNFGNTLIGAINTKSSSRVHSEYNNIADINVESKESKVSFSSNSQYIAHRTENFEYLALFSRGAGQSKYPSAFELAHISARIRKGNSGLQFGISIEATQSSLDIEGDDFYPWSHTKAQQSKVTFDLSETYNRLKGYTFLTGSLAIVADKISQRVQNATTEQYNLGAEVTLVAEFEPKKVTKVKAGKPSSFFELVEGMAYLIDLIPDSFTGIPFQIGYRNYLPLISKQKIYDYSFWLGVSSRLGEQKGISYSFQRNKVRTQKDLHSFLEQSNTLTSQKDYTLSQLEPTQESISGFEHSLAFGWQLNKYLAITSLKYGMNEPSLDLNELGAKNGFLKEVSASLIRKDQSYGLGLTYYPELQQTVLKGIVSIK